MDHSLDHLYNRWLYDTALEDRQYDQPLVVLFFPSSCFLRRRTSMRRFHASIAHSHI